MKFTKLYLFNNTFLTEKPQAEMYIDKKYF